MPLDNKSTSKFIVIDFNFFYFFVLFCFVLFCFVLLCFVLFCFVFIGEKERKQNQENKIKIKPQILFELHSEFPSSIIVLFG